MRVEMRLVKRKTSAPDIRALSGQLETDVQWEPLLQAASMSWPQYHSLKFHCWKGKHEKPFLGYRLIMSQVISTTFSVLGSYCLKLLFCLIVFGFCLDVLTTYYFRLDFRYNNSI